MSHRAGGLLEHDMARRRFSGPVDAAFALPLAFLGMLIIGVAAVVAGPTHRAGVVVVLTCLLVASVSATTQVVALLPLVAIGWFTIAGFAGTPLGDLHHVA